MSLGHALYSLGEARTFETLFCLSRSFGSLAAFIHPVFDPFAFPHLTFFTFVIGHYALTVNCMLYLLSDLEGEMLKGKEVVKYTLIMNMLILGVALLTGGNYGF